jgi:hypothetical protein
MPVPAVDMPLGNDFPCCIRRSEDYPARAEVAGIEIGQFSRRWRGTYEISQWEIAMTEPRKDLGENDVNFTDVIGDVAEKAADSFACAPSAGRAICVDLAHGHALRCLRHPSDIGLDYEETFFPSVNGIPLEAWFIRANSDKLLIVNHPMTCNRYGFPGHCLLGIRCLAVLALDVLYGLTTVLPCSTKRNSTTAQRFRFGGESRGLGSIVSSISVGILISRFDPQWWWLLAFLH